MTLDRQTYYSADCDVRLDRATGEPLNPQPGAWDWIAWGEAGNPKSGPLFDAIGDGCRETSDRIREPTIAAVRRRLMKLGWRIIPVGRGRPPRAACPKHREVDL